MSAAKVTKKKSEPTLKGARWWKEVGWRHVVAIVMIIYCLVPLLYVLSVSLNPGATLTGSNKLFSNVSFDNYMSLGSGKYAAYWSWVVNSLIVSTTTAIGTVLMGAAAAYAFSRFRFKGRRGTLTGLLLVQMFPQMLAFVALYLLLLGIQDIFPVMGLNSKLGLICVCLGGALGSNTFLLYGFFNSIPRSLDEAAMIDGCNPVQTYFRVVMPMLKPTAITVAILNAMWVWNDYLLPYLVIGLSTKYKTIPVVVQTFVGSNGNRDLGAMMAMLVLAIVPIVIFYISAQKYIIEGVAAGAVKG